MKELTVSDVELVAFHLAQRHLAFDEPIPDFACRHPNVLESCLAVPFQRFYGRSAYPTLVAKASILLYLMIKNHPFQNGNERLAITTLLVLLLNNKKWLTMDLDLLYRFTLWIAESKPEDKDFILAAIHRVLSAHLQKA
ncbi:MAG: Fic family protein [Phycisphaerales bacterium]